MDLSKRITNNDPWQEEIEGSTLLSPTIDTAKWERMVRFPGDKDDDYAIEVELALIAGQHFNKQVYKEAGVILRYSGENQYYYAGLGGFGARTFISMVRPEHGSSIWDCLDSQGRKEEIRLNRTYKLRLECRGATITLSEDNKNRYTVEVDKYSTGYWGLRTVRTQARFAKIVKTGPSVLKALVVMPFTPSLSFVYETIEKVVVTDQKLVCHRVDKSRISRIILEDITEWLTTADLIIADLTNVNPNVYYEAGFAHALRKKLILIAQRGTPIEFNLRPIRTLFYEDPTDLARQLNEAIDETLAPERGR